MRMSSPEPQRPALVSSFNYMSVSWQCVSFVDQCFVLLCCAHGWLIFISVNYPEITLQFTILSTFSLKDMLINDELSMSSQNPILPQTYLYFYVLKLPWQWFLSCLGCSKKKIKIDGQIEIFTIPRATTNRERQRERERERERERNPPW